MKEDNNISITEATLVYYHLPDVPNSGDIEDFEFEIKPFEIELNTEGNEIKFHSSINITAVTKESNPDQELTLETGSQIIFSYEELSIEDNKLDDETEQNLSAIAYSTIRGLITGLTKGTAFGNAYLPVQEFSVSPALVEEHEIETPSPPM